MCSQKKAIVCDICPLTKQTRLQFPSNSITIMLLLDLIHCVICYGYFIPIFSCARFFKTIVNNFFSLQLDLYNKLRFKSASYNLTQCFLSHIQMMMWDLIETLLTFLFIWGIEKRVLEVKSYFVKIFIGGKDIILREGRGFMFAILQEI